MEVSGIPATIKDVAKYTGLSVATISKYINGGNVLDRNRDLIGEAVKALDYKVNEIARGLKTRKSKTVGVLIPKLDSIFTTTIVSYIEGVLQENGYGTIICDYRQDPGLEAVKLEFLLGKSVDGIIMMPLALDAAQLQRIIKNDTPVIFIDRTVKGFDSDVVMADNLNASYGATEYLITRGHKRIGFICGPQDIYTAQERLKGYLRVHDDYGLKIDEKLIKYGDYEIESGYNYTKELLDILKPPAAIFATNYEMTIGAIMALNERNVKIPDEVSFIGFDNIHLADLVKPPLSIVVQPMRQIGETAGSLMMRRLKGDRTGFPAIIRLKTELLIKDSVRDISGVG